MTGRKKKPLRNKEATANPLSPKITWRPGNIVAPAPAALVSCQGTDGTANLITIAWCGNICSDPPMLSVSIRPSRFSYEMLVATGELVVNIPSRAMAKGVDYCGVVSGRDIDKWGTTGFTRCEVPGVNCPGVAEAPINIGCKVTQRLALGSHDLFLARVEGVTVTENCIDADGKFRLDRADLLCFAHGEYFSLGKRQGHFGWSIRKRKGQGSKK